MAYEMVMPYHLHMPSYFLETFTEYPYGKYQRRVRRIPNIGTASTKDWYIEYQASVQRIPNVGMKHTRRWYNTIKG